MARRKKTTKRPKPKAILRLPDLEQSKNAVLNSLAAVSSQESYAHAIDEFIAWYCSEPRLLSIGPSSCVIDSFLNKRTWRPQPSTCA